MKHIRIKKLDIEIPPFKERTELETEMLLHKHKVLERKHQIELVKLDNEIPLRTFNLKEYRTPKSRMELFKKIGSAFRLLLP